MKIKDTIKLLKYNPTPQMNIVVVIIFGVCAFITAIPAVNNIVGAFWANYMPMYLIGQIYLVGISGVVQSSDKYRKTFTKNLAILLALANLLEYILFVVIRTIVAYKMGMGKGVNSFLIAYMLFQILYVIYGALIYKKTKLGIAIMIPIFMLIIFANNNDTLSFADKIGSMASVGVFLGLTAVVSALTPVMFYVLNRLMYKVPIADGITKRIERQETI